jgi:protein phosphatase
MSLALQVAGKSDVGCVRANNEDNFGYDLERGIFVVCDGMGGAAAGEVASKLAVDTVLTYFRQGASDDSYPTIGKTFAGFSPAANALASAIQLANAAVHEAGNRHAAQSGMGSTIVALWMRGELFSIAHVGDSRIYRLRGGQLLQLTDDHSLVMEQVRRGLITREEAEHSEMQNVIIRALGSEPEVEPDLDDLVAQPGDALLLATDGLTKQIVDEEIRAILEAAPKVEQACDLLVQAAKDHGGEDNVTCLLIRVVQQSWYKDLFRKLSRRGAPQWQSSF